MNLKNLIDFCKKKIATGGADFTVYRQLLDVLLMADKFDLYPTEVPGDVYQRFVEAYFDFRKKRGANPKMNPAAGKALKEIIRYLLRNEKVNNDPENALKAWRFILDRWSMLSEFIRSQVGLTQINKHIEEIIDQLTHVTKKAKQQHNQSEIEQLERSIKSR